MNYNVNNENERIIIGEVGENLAESCTIDYSAWVEEYGEGDLRIRAIREGDAEPYPVANVETADGVATWTYTAADTAVKGFGEVQVLYYVGDVLAKSRVWKTYTYRSLSTSSEEVPDPYADWLSAVERIGGQVEADAEAASVSADSASASATLAAGSASEAAESALSASRSASAAMGSASAASTSAESAASSATAASRSATEASNYEYYSEQYMNEAKSAKFGAESARTGAENAKAAAQASATAAAQSAAQAEETAESIEASADLIQKLLANQIHDTATGTIATYPDGADMPMVSLVADIDPIQDTSGGAPSPSNICPISGWDEVETVVSGVNVWDEEVESGYLNVSTGQNAPDDSRYRCKNYIEVLPNTEYYFKTSDYAVAHNIVHRLYYYDADKNFISSPSGSYTSHVFTTPSNAHYVRFFVNGALSGFDNTISINYPSTDTEYHAYQGQTITTTIPQTVYGGTLDVVSGVLTVDKGVVTFDGSSDEYWNAETYQSGTKIFTRFADIKADSNKTKPLMTNMFVFRAYSVADYGQITNVYWNTSNLEMTVPQTMTVEEWRQFLQNTPLEIVYELAQPQTYTLTGQEINTFLGENNVWADSGDVTVEYIADTKLYIQKVIS